MLENNDLVFTQQLLLMMNINKEVGVVRIQIMYGDVIHLLRRPEQNPVSHRVMRFRMGIQQQNLGRLQHRSPPIASSEQRFSVTMLRIV